MSDNSTRKIDSRCAVCGSTENLVGHHIIPTFKGGTDAPDNITTLCQDCHRQVTYTSHSGSRRGGKETLIGTFYLGRPYTEYWQEFKKITKREDSTASEKIREFIKGYVDKHSHGNPQTLMSRYQENTPDHVEERVDQIGCNHFKRVYPKPPYCGAPWPWDAFVPERCYLCSTGRYERPET